MDPSRSPGPPAPGLAACLLGHWRETSNIATENLGIAVAIVTTGAFQTYAGGGVYTVDYTHAVQTYTVGGQSVRSDLAGTVTGKYTLSTTWADYSDLVATGTYRATANGAPLAGQLTISSDQHDNLTCTGDHLTQTGYGTDPATGGTVTYAVELDRA